MKDASVYLKHIQDAIARIESYTGQGRKAFFDNTISRDVSRDVARKVRFPAPAA